MKPALPITPTSDPAPPFADLFQTGLFRGLSTETRDRLAACGTLTTLPRGHQLTTQGQPETCIAVVLSGTLAVSRHRHGHRAKVGVLRRGATIGVMHLIDPHPACADVVAVDGPATIWTAPDDKIREFLIPGSPDAFAILQALAGQLCRRTRSDRNDLWRHLDATQAFFRNMDL